MEKNDAICPTYFNIGLAFTINETFDKILLQRLLPSDISESQVGMYAACYKIGVLMTLFTTAFRLGIEPYFLNILILLSPNIIMQEF